MLNQPLELHPKTTTFTSMFLGLFALVVLSVLAAVAANAIWLVPVLVLGGEGLIYLHQRHVGVTIDESHRTLIVQNFFVRYEIPFTSIERIEPGLARVGTPSHNVGLANRRGAVHSINIRYRARDGKERVVAPMSTQNQSFRAPRASPLVDGLVALCQGRSIPCDLGEFGATSSAVATSTPTIPPAGTATVTPGHATVAPATGDGARSLLFVNGVGVRRGYAIASISLVVVGFASTTVAHSGALFFVAGLAAVTLVGIGRSR